MLVVAIVLLAGAVVLGVLATLAQRKRKAMVGTETLSVADLAALRDAAVQAAGPGSFRYKCEVVGQAQPGPDGLLQAGMSHTKCAWYKNEVTHRYRERQRTSKGRSRWVNHSEKVAKFESETLFTVAEATGALAVDPRGAHVDSAEKVHDRFIKGHRQDGPEVQFGGVTLKTRSRQHTIGYRYEEWVLRTGRQLYVLGEVVDAGGQLVVVKPSSGPYIVSTRNEEQILASETKKRTWFSVGAGVVALAGVVVLVVALLA